MNRSAPAIEASGPAAPRKRSVVIAGHRTSITLEDAFWDALQGVALERGLSAAALVAEIDAGRGAAGLSSAIRVHLLQYYRGRSGSQLTITGCVI